VEVKVLRTSKDSDHSQFLITDKNNYQLEEDIAINDVEILSNGSSILSINKSGKIRISQPLLLLLSVSIRNQK